MTDFTYRFYAACKPYSDWNKYHYDEDQSGAPTCHWNQFIDAGEPVKKDGVETCPNCGSIVIYEKWAE